MGCAVQVHEKTDKRGTWAYHTVDGWYLATSPEHYRTHLCHVKETRSERLSDTVHFSHKNITRPTVTHADKIMRAIAECAKAIKGMEGEQGKQEMEQLQKLTETVVSNNAEVAKHLLQQPAARAEITGSNDTATPGRQVASDGRQTRSMTANMQQVPRVHTAAVPRVEATAANQADSGMATKAVALLLQRATKLKQRRRKKAAAKTVPADAPARNTRAQTRVAASRKATIAKPTAKGTRASTKAKTQRSRLMQPTASSRKKTRKGAALTAEQNPRKKKMSARSRMRRLENEVQQAMAVMDADTGKLLNYKQLMRSPKYKKKWATSSANEFGRLANGIGGRIKKPTNTIKFIKRKDIPRDRRKDVTYGSFVCNVRPEKEEQERTRFVVGGDRINYPGEVATPTADMLVAKILFNSVVSTNGAKFMTMDISNFYLMTPLKRPEYIRVSLKDIPEEVIKEYKLKDIAMENGTVHIEANKGMYGLPQAGLLANQLLEKRLNKRGYFQSKLVPGLWKHKWRPVQFTLVVDDFGVKYVGKEHAKHLRDTLREDYTVTTDWTGKRYIGITLDWDYKRRQVHLSMPKYVKKALKQFQHTLNKRQYQPFPSAKIDYGAKKQYAKQESKSPLLDKKGKKFVQRVCGKFLFLGRAVDSTLLCPISAIASQSSAPTEDTMKHTLQLLDYIATQEEAVLTYNASAMKLAVHSDASYLSEPKARSRAGGHFFLSNEASAPGNNGAVLNIAHIIKHVMSSATESELAALYIMAHEAVYIRIILEEMGHKQPPTPLQTDNAMADAVCNGKIQPKRTKAMDMRFHWLRDRECQKQFRIYWRPGKLNYADYWTKHHTAAHHKGVRKEFLTPHKAVEMLRVEQNRLAAAAA